MVLCLTVRVVLPGHLEGRISGWPFFLRCPIWTPLLFLGAELVAAVEAGDLDLIGPDAAGDGSGQATSEEHTRSGFPGTEALFVCGEGGGAALGAAGHTGGLVILDSLFRLAPFGDRSRRTLYGRCWFMRRWSGPLNDGLCGGILANGEVNR